MSQFHLLIRLKTKVQQIMIQRSKNKRRVKFKQTKKISNNNLNH